MGETAPQAWMGIAGNLGAVAFVLWLAHHLTTSALPKMAGEFRDALERQRTDFRASLAEQRKDFLGALDKERGVHREVLNRQTTAINRVHDAIRDHDAWERQRAAEADRDVP